MDTAVLSKKYVSSAIDTHLEFCKILEQKCVSVCVSSKRLIRNRYHTHMSICGILQKHLVASGCYRVVVTDGSYVYFKLVDIETIMTRSPILDIYNNTTSKTFKDSSVAVIWIKITDTE